MPWIVDDVSESAHAPSAGAVRVTSMRCSPVTRSLISGAHPSPRVAITKEEASNHAARGASSGLIFDDWPSGVLG